MRRILAIIALIAGFATAMLYNRDMERTRSRLRAAGRLIHTRFGDIDYATLGQGEPVLVLHGASGGFDQALDMTAPLAKEGFKLIAPSRFGYLRSTIPRDHGPAAQADACAAMLDKLRIDTVSVIAISAGAWPGLHFAARHPGRCRALVLLVPATALPKGTRLHGGWLTRAVFWSDFLGWAIVRLGAIIPALGGPLLGTPPGMLARADASERKRFRQVLYDSLPARSRRDGMTIDIANASPDNGCRLDDIACPVLAISARDDTFDTAARAREVAGAVQQGTVVIYSSGGHALVNRQGDALDEITAFLKRAH